MFEDDNDQWFFEPNYAEAVAGARGRELVAIVDKFDRKKVLMYVLKDKLGPCTRMLDWEKTWVWKPVIVLDQEG